MLAPTLSTNVDVNVNNKLNLKSASSQTDGYFWGNVIRHLFKLNLPGIMHRIEFSFFGKKLCDYVELSADDWKFLFNSDNEFILLIDLKVECNEFNKQKLIKVWNILVKQSETCLQGASYYAFTNFIALLTGYHLKSLNVEELWVNLCDNMHNKFSLRKPSAMTLGNFFSLRMF